MQLESHATPIGETPQQRYASLHRAIERGLSSDDVWCELSLVSLKLGHRDEAVRCARRIEDEGKRRPIEHRLERLGLIETPGAAHAEVVGPAGATAGSPAGREHPSRDHAGHAARHHGVEQQPGVIEHLLDAFQYLFHQHMPWLALTTMLAFPLVVGVGGFLNAGGSLLLLAAIAALPGLCVLAVIAAMGRRILLASSEGIGDVPPIPAFANLVVDAQRFALDAALVLAIFVAPAVFAVTFGAPVITMLPVFAASATFAPLAFALRQMRGDWEALSPVVLCRAIQRCGAGYPVLAGVTVLLFAPATGMACASAGRPVWVQIAIVGPLCVLPIFVGARLIGSWLDTRRAALGALLRPGGRGTEAPREPAAEAPAQAEPRFPRRPEALQHFKAPVARTTKRREQAKPKAPPPASAIARTAAPAARTAKAPPRAIEGRGPSRPGTAGGQPQRPAGPAPAAAGQPRRLPSGPPPRR